MDFVTLDTLTKDLLNVIRGSNISQSEPISVRQLEAWIHQYRSLILKRDLDKGKHPNPDYIQEINALILEAEDEWGDDVAGTFPALIDDHYKIYRTNLTIPKTLDLNFKSGLMYVGSPMGKEIQFIPQGRAEWQQYKKYTHSDSMAFLKNQYIYVIAPDGLEYITIRGIFEEPPSVSRFVNAETDQPYWNEDSVYPIPMNMIPILKEMILQKELKIEASAPSDVTNDSVLEVSPPVEQQAMQPQQARQ